MSQPQRTVFAPWWTGLRHWLLEPVVFGYAIAGLVAIHLAPVLEPDAMKEALSRLNVFAFQAALALSAWRICLGPAVRKVGVAARNLGRDDDDEQAPR